MVFDPKVIIAETKWLLAHPHFEQKPASITEFIGAGYLDIESKIRPGLRKALVDLFGKDVNGTRISNYEQAMITGGIGIGKTTFASIALPYMAHWVLCLKDPQDFFELLPGSRIAFMQMSTSEDQAREVIFGDIKARIQHSAWFVNNYPHDDKWTKQIRFPKDIWILPGDSAETTFEGYNILAGILDEMDSHKVTKDKDYADQGFDTINSRIASRYIDDETKGHKGLLICIGQMKKGNGFGARKYDEMMINPRAYVMRMSIWESLGWKRFTNSFGVRESFWYDIKRKKVIPSAIVEFVENADFIEIPLAYKNQFDNNPEKALRDLAGIPPKTSDPFISLTDRIDEARDKWITRHGDTSPVKTNPTRCEFEDWFKAENDPRKRTVHIDLAVSADGDAAGIAMGHVEEIVEIDNERKPYVVIDCLIRLKAMPGTEIMLSDIRRIIYYLKEELHFKIYSVTMDGFQSLVSTTRIPLLDGRTLTMGELATQYPDGGVWAYSYDHVTGRIVPGKVTKAWQTGSNKNTVLVTLDNDETIECTPEHQFMLRDGSYARACNLTPGQSIMPLYRRITNGYEQIAQPVSEVSTRWYDTHVSVAGDVSDGFIRHHRDHNKLNNSPDNLDVISRSVHSAHHNQREYWTDERRESVGVAISKSNTELTGEDSRRRRLDVTLSDLIPLVHLCRRDVTSLYGYSQDMIYARVREAGYTGWSDFRKKNSPVNHKVVSVVETSRKEDVYDLQIVDHSNFALESGVFVHNSTDTMQQLRKKKYHVDYLSVDRSTLPYEDLREAIYERRLEFPPYKTFIKKGDDKLVEVAVQELQQLTDTGKKIDHPAGGSKDLADAMAGVTSTLMGDRTFRKGIRFLTSSEETETPQQATGTTGSVIPFPTSGAGLRAPIPNSSGGSMGLTIPQRLRPGRNR